MAGSSRSTWFLILGGIISGVATATVSWLIVRAQQEKAKENAEGEMPYLPQKGEERYEA